VPTSFDHVVAKFEKRRAGYSGAHDRFAFALRTPGGTSRTLGQGEPLFTLAAADQQGLDALGTLDQLAIAEAYLHGHVEIEGDVEALLAHRNFFPDRHPIVRAWQLLRPQIFGRVPSDQGWIAQHYDTESEFFLTFLDARHRCYSHAVYEHDDEPLEVAMTRKMDFAIDSIGVEPGARVLDVGGGWGAFTQHAGCKGIRVTSLTISRESERFLNELIRREQIPCTVRYEHLYDHTPAEPYDAIVVLGVTEHLPDYDKSLARYQSLLRPGGRVYLDACAARKKHKVSSFFRRHVFPGAYSPMCLYDYLRAVAASPFQLKGVWDDRHSYERTVREWAIRLDEKRQEIEQRWGSALYRKFRLYLWGSADAMRRDAIQAYRVVLSLPA
jgi:cyclopropane-fatty-acyl-phospholipid synthase